jgi:Xaa-Pro aminopeptidase
VVVTEAPPPPGAERQVLRFEVLTLAPFDRALIDPALLTAPELAWLNAYHARIAAEIGPLVEAQARPWLLAATHPLSRVSGTESLGHCWP